MGKKNFKNNLSDPKQKESLRRSISLLKPQKLQVILSLVLAIISVGMSLAAPIVCGKAIDKMTGAGVDTGAVMTLAGIFLVLIGINAVSQMGMSLVNNKITYSVTRKLRIDLFGHIQELPIQYMDSNATGATLNRMIADVDQLSDGLLLGFSKLFSSAVMIVATIVIMFILSWQIAIVVVVLTPLSLFVAKYISKQTFTMFKAQSDIRGEMTTIIDDMIGNQKIVQAFNHQDYVVDQFQEVNVRLRDVSQKAVFASSLTNPSTRFVNGLVYAGVAIVGCIIAINSPSAMTIGLLSAFLSYANQYTKPFNDISSVITEIQNALACASRVFELMDEEEQSDDSRSLRLGHAANGNIEFRHVYFSYIPMLPFMENISFKVFPGQRVAIVGPTGCGKTTLINLLMRFYDVDSGTVAVDAMPVQEMVRNSLRECFGMVLQETWLKNATVFENIAYGKPNATFEEVREAAMEVHADSFIQRLPNGYDTVIGEDGGILSQGQKQLICIARVMLTKPPMLILDEATSSIDTRTEMKIQDAFAKLMRGRTSIIVAHRLSTIKNCDLILVMDDGRIVEAGTHDALLAYGGVYTELYNSQFAYDT
ncbi:MAG: ABC transporter ATP-binding protein [Lachnospiraceae bacterium]|nr:ABC transporter ATP-binding protein [Lachnospiraceae bacterium]